jgi:hypothetical protein
MHRSTWVLTTAFIAAAAAAGAQTGAPALSAMQMAIACAPPPTLDGEPGKALHIVGGQDSVARTAFGSRELVILDGGKDAGVQPGAQFFVRRANRFAMYGPGHGQGATTLGWLHVVAVNDSTAVAQVDHACGAVISNDYLEPFVAPVAPAGIDSVEATGEPDFDAVGRIISGSEGRSTLGAGDFALIDRGSEQGVAPGQRLAIYRDVRVSGLPLASIGDAVVVSASDSVALARITRARDAVLGGDFIAPRK